MGGAGNWCGWGASCPGLPIAWASNGLTWSAAITEGELLNAGAAVYTAAPGGFIAVSRGQTYASADGISWTQLAESSIDGSEGDGAALAITDDGRLALVGTRYHGSDVDPWIVFGEFSPQGQSSSPCSVVDGLWIGCWGHRKFGDKWSCAVPLASPIL